MSGQAKRLSRRNFLLTVGVGGAATAAAIVAKTSGTQAVEKEKSKHTTRGYHASEHINNYYRTTKV